MPRVNPQRRAETRRSRSALGLLLALAAGCYGHQATHTPFSVGPSALPAPRAGRYVISRGGEEVGVESLTITATAGWTARGETRVGGLRRAFAVRVDPASLEPTGASIAIAGGPRDLRRDARVRAGYVVVRGGPVVQRVPYAAGTQIDVGVPGAGAWVYGALSARLHPGAEVWVRTVELDPLRRAQVSLRGYFVRRAQDGLRLVEVRDAAGAVREALWLAPDGFVVRARRAGPSGVIERRWAPDER